MEKAHITGYMNIRWLGYAMAFAVSATGRPRLPIRGGRVVEVDPEELKAGRAEDGVAVQH
jgi:hypothetical protein